jgi:hypothetical protein
MKVASPGSQTANPAVAIFAPEPIAEVAVLPEAPAPQLSAPSSVAPPPAAAVAPPGRPLPQMDSQPTQSVENDGKVGTPSRRSQRKLPAPPVK